MKTISFREKLRRRQQKIKSLLCIGLDPLLEKMPQHLKTPGPPGAHEATDTAIWMMSIVDATAPFACMYKLQRAHWEAIPGGVIAMQMVISYIKARYPDIVVFVDCKRGDIGQTQSRYRTAHFDIDGAEGVNFSPYMGKDCLQYLIDENHNVRAVVGLCFTTNPSAREVQDVELQDGRKYWEFMAETILKWSEDLGVSENTGLVMAAAHEFPKKSGIICSDHLTRAREIVGDNLWFLIPGIGTQGGFIKETVKAAHTGYGSIAINASSSIIFASQGEDFAEKAANEARLLYIAIAEALGIEKDDWIQESLIVEADPLTTLKNCGGYYNAKVEGKIVGPLVAYNGTYPVPAMQDPDGDTEKTKNYIGLEYYDFAYVEMQPTVLHHFARLIINALKDYNDYQQADNQIQPDLFIGAAYGGIMLSGAISDLMPGTKAIFTSKKIIALATDTDKEKSRTEINRHLIRTGTKGVIVEDVSNNQSDIDAIVALAAARGCKIVALVCAFNRSEKDSYKGLPIISACHIPTEQFVQHDLMMIGAIKEWGIEMSPKTHFEALKACIKG